jgi:hypothetical protein
MRIPVAEQKQTEKRASGKEKRNPEIMDRNMEPGMANVWIGPQDYKQSSCQSINQSKARLIFLRPGREIVFFFK